MPFTFEGVCVCLHVCPSMCVQGVQRKVSDPLELESYRQLPEVGARNWSWEEKLGQLLSHLSSP